MTKKPHSTKIQRLALSALVAMISGAVFVATILTIPVLAENGVNQAQEAAQVQKLAAFMKLCVNDKGAYGSGSIPNKERAQQIYRYQGLDKGLVKNGEIFNDWGIGKAGRAKTSYWLEKQIAGKANDTQLLCSENKSKIVSLFKKKVAPEMSMGEYMSLILKCEPKDSKHSKGDEACNNIDDSVKFTYRSSKDAENNIRKLYNNWKIKSHNGYAPSFGNLKKKNAAMSFWHNIDEFSVVCMDSDARKHMVKQGKEDKSKTYFRSTFPSVDANGNITHYKVPNTGVKGEVTESECNNFLLAASKNAAAAASSIAAAVKESGHESTMQTAGNTEALDGETDQFENNCFNQSGFIGWIICPAISLMSDAMRFIYNTWIGPSLTFSPDFIKTDGDNAAAYKAWSGFRNIANVIFIIMFLIVIISQITGVGIGNYGIKKALPRLILAAILINLSFFICQLAVDVSNVVGSGAQSFLSTTGKGLVESNDKAGALFKTSSIGASVIASAGLVGVFGSATIGMLLPLFMTIVSAVISLLFLLTILAARKALIILLIVISPVAFALYALPIKIGGASSVFSRWLGLFKTMLMLYPICGLLIGGGQLASAIVISSGGGDDTFLTLVGIIIEIIPYFFIPSLTKKSLDGLAGMGSKIAGLNKASPALNKSAKASYDRAREKAALSSGVFGWRDKLGKSKFGKSIGYSQRRHDAVLSEMKRRQQAGNLDRVNSEQGRSVLEASIQANEMTQAVKDEEALLETSGLSSDIDKLEREYKAELSKPKESVNAARIRALQNTLSRKGEKGRAAVAAAYQAAEASENGISDIARNTHSSNLMDNWAKDYKDNARSTYDHAAQNQGKEEHRFAETLAKAGNKLTAQQYASMDESELKNYIQAAEAGNVYKDDVKGMREQIQTALQAGADGKIALKPEQKALIETLDGRLERTPQTAERSTPEDYDPYEGWA